MRTYTRNVFDGINSPKLEVAGSIPALPTISVASGLTLRRYFVGVAKEVRVRSFSSRSSIETGIDENGSSLLGTFWLRREGEYLPENPSSADFAATYRECSQNSATQQPPLT